MRGLRIGSVLLAIAFGVLIAGCGGGGDDPADTVQEYFDAATGDDFEGACELLSEQTITLIEGTGDDCPTALEADEATPVPDDFEVGDSTEDGDTASVTVSGDGEEVAIPLVKEDDEWKVDLAGLVTGGDSSAASSDTTTTEP